MAKTTTAVIGVGYLGRLHAYKYAHSAASRLLAVVDTDPRVAAAVANEVGARACTDYRELAGSVEAVSIVTPTRAHFDIARYFIENGAHVLIEKPITPSVAQADQLIELADRKGRILQIGHLERFNTAILDLKRLLATPVFIETHRLAPFRLRGTDVSVVLDLMIHDIDIILDIVHSDVARIDASGMAVLSEAIDIANARLVFANGCIANVTASRVSQRTERKLRIFQHNAYISVDFQEHVVAVHRKDGNNPSGDATIRSEQHRYDEGDALASEIEHFLRAIRYGEPPLVSGLDGRRALETAIAITEQVTRGA